MIESDRDRKGLAWQTGVWNRIADVYHREIEPRFAAVVGGVIARASLAAGEDVLDLGTGTGAVAQQAAALVSPGGHVTAVDVSFDMLTVAHQRANALGLRNIGMLAGRAESIPAASDAFDVVFACLSLMYVINREAAAAEIARVLRPNGRVVAAVWAGPEQCDIVLFQETAGRFAGTPPVAGVGPGALADASDFLRQLAAAGIEARVETETLGFDFADFASAWNTLAGVTTTQLSYERLNEAQNAVKAAMYPDGDQPRHFRNVTQFIIGRRAARPQKYR